MSDKPKRIPVGVWIAAGIFAASFAIGIASKFVQPSNLTMSLIEFFQFAVLIGLFIWFMNWRSDPTIWELQKKRRQELMELRGCDPGKSPEPPLDPPADSN